MYSNYICKTWKTCHSVIIPGATWPKLHSTYKSGLAKISCDDHSLLLPITQSYHSTPHKQFTTPEAKTFNLHC